jgi:hypothetical protein
MVYFLVSTLIFKVKVYGEGLMLMLICNVTF